MIFIHSIESKEKISKYLIEIMELTRMKEINHVPTLEFDSSNVTSVEKFKANLVSIICSYMKTVKNKTISWNYYFKRVLFMVSIYAVSTITSFLIVLLIISAYLD